MQIISPLILFLSLSSTKIFSASNGGNRTLHHARLRGSNNVTGEIVEVALWWVWVCKSIGKLGVSLQIDLAVIDGFCGRLLGQEWWHRPFAWVVECFFGWLLGFVVQWLWLLGFVWKFLGIWAVVGFLWGWLLLGLVFLFLLFLILMDRSCWLAAGFWNWVGTKKLF